MCEEQLVQAVAALLMRLLLMLLLGSRCIPSL